MNTQTIKQEYLRRAMALGLPLTGRENSLITLFGQSATYEKEDKPAFVDKYLKPLVVALGTELLDDTKNKRGKQYERNKNFTKNNLYADYQKRRSGVGNAS